METSENKILCGRLSSRAIGNVRECLLKVGSVMRATNSCNLFRDITVLGCNWNLQREVRCVGYTTLVTRVRQVSRVVQLVAQQIFMLQVAVNLRFINTTSFRNILLQLVTKELLQNKLQVCSNTCNKRAT